MESAVDKKHETAAAKAKSAQARAGELEEELEEGLKETFPGSDAPAATQPVHHEHEAPKKR
jgi:hypothetical protein